MQTTSQQYISFEYLMGAETFGGKRNLRYLHGSKADALKYNYLQRIFHWSRRKGVVQISKHLGKLGSGLNTFSRFKRLWLISHQSVISTFFNILHEVYTCTRLFESHWMMVLLIYNLNFFAVWNFFFIVHVFWVNLLLKWKKVMNLYK